MKYPLNMREKNLLSIAVIFIVSIAIVGAAIWSMDILMVPAAHAGYTPHSAPAIWMDPNSTDLLNKSDTFTVSIVVNITDPPGLGSGLYMWEYKLYWEKDWLSLSSKAPIIKAGTNDTLLGWHTDYFIPANTEGTDYHWYGVSALAPAPPFTGVMWLCNYTFRVEDQPYLPALNYTGNFDFHLEAMADDKLGLILPPDTDWVIGTFQLLSVPIPPPELEVKPAKVHGVYGEKFNITIEIKHLITATNMCRWNATLSYNTTMLDAEASWEGPLLPKFEGPGGTNYTDAIDDTLGTVYTAGSFVGLPATPPNETGVLATIEFNATWPYEVLPTIPPFSCSLSLYNTTLVNCANATISHTVVNATYNAPYKTKVTVIDHAIVFEGETYHVFTESNSSVSPVPMNFSQPEMLLRFNVTGTAGYYGFCNVTIPRVLLNATPGDWKILLDGTETIYKWPLIVDNDTHVRLDFTYQLSTHKVEIEGTWVVPEFPIAMILPLLFMATLTAAILGKKVRSGKRRGYSVAE